MKRSIQIMQELEISCSGSSIEPPLSNQDEVISNDLEGQGYTTGSLVTELWEVK